MFLFPWFDWGDDISDFEKSIFWPMSHFGVFPATGQADFLPQRHLRHWAENFQKMWYEKKIFEIFFEKLLSFPEIYFGHVGTI